MAKTTKPDSTKSDKPDVRTVRHLQLARLWCQWNGKRGTDKQALNVRCTEAQLERMLSERGVVLQADGTIAVRRKGAPVLPAAKTCDCKPDCQRWLPCTCACHEEAL